LFNLFFLGGATHPLFLFILYFIIIYVFKKAVQMSCAVAPVDSTSVPRLAKKNTQQLNGHCYKVPGAY